MTLCDIGEDTIDRRSQSKTSIICLILNLIEKEKNVKFECTEARISFTYDGVFNRDATKVDLYTFSCPFDVSLQ